MAKAWWKWSLPFHTQIRARIAKVKDTRGIKLWEGNVKPIEDVVIVEGDSIILPKVPDASQVPMMILVVELLEGCSSPEGEEGGDAVLQRNRVPCAERLTPVEAQEISIAEKLGAIGGPDLGLLSALTCGRRKTV